MVERPRVVDEDVDRAELFGDPPHRLVHLLALGHVAAARESAAPHLRDLLDRPLRVDHPLRAGRLRERTVLLGRLARIGLELDVGDRDVGPCPSQCQRVGPP